MKKYEEFEHTADLGLRVYGGSLRTLLINAGEGMFSLMGEVNAGQQQSGEIRIEIAFSDPAIPSVYGLDSVECAQDLLPAWLRRLLTEFNLHAFFPVDYSIQVCDQGLAGTVGGKIFDPARDVFFTEIKGVTFHAFKVVKMDDGLQADVIFDV